MIQMGFAWSLFQFKLLLNDSLSPRYKNQLHWQACVLQAKVELSTSTRNHWEIGSYKLALMIYVTEINKKYNTINYSLCCATTSGEVVLKILKGVVLGVPRSYRERFLLRWQSENASCFIIGPMVPSNRECPTIGRMVDELEYRFLRRLRGLTLLLL